MFVRNRNTKTVFCFVDEWGAECLHGKQKRSSHFSSSKDKASITYVPLDVLLHNTKCCTILEAH